MYHRRKKGSRGYWHTTEATLSSGSKIAVSLSFLIPKRLSKVKNQRIPCPSHRLNPGFSLHNAVGDVEKTRTSQRICVHLRRFLTAKSLTPLGGSVGSEVSSCLGSVLGEGECAGHLVCPQLFLKGSVLPSHIYPLAPIQAGPQRTFPGCSRLKLVELLSQIALLRIPPSGAYNLPSR